MIKKRFVRLHDATSAEIHLAGQIFPYTLIKSKAARQARLKVTAANGLSVILPQNYPLSYAEEFIRNKQHWIKKKLAMVQHNQQVYADDSRIQYLGKPLNICRRDSSDSTTTVKLTDSELEVSLPPAVNEMRPVVNAWLKTRARSTIIPLAERHSQHMNVSYTAIHIRTAKTRWGSCSPRGALSFNWKLVMMPPETITYVVIHELCHLREMNHSHTFWKLVEQYCPDWRTHRRWLRCNDGALAY